jgi:hypothetical protein
MKLFKRNRKAREKWRTAARMIDLHKTKVTIMRATKGRPQPVQHLPPWFYQKMLNAVPDDSCARDSVKPDPEMPQRHSSQDMHTKLMQYFG